MSSGEDLLRRLPLAAARIDPAGRVAFANAALKALAASSDFRLKGISARSLFKSFGRDASRAMIDAFRAASLNDTVSVVEAIILPQDATRDVRVTLIPEKGFNSAAYVIVVVEDLTPSRRAPLVAGKSANTDTVTGLPNLAALTRVLNDWINGSARRSNRRFSVMAVQLHNLNRISNMLGRSVRDALVRAAATYLESHVHCQDVVAKIGDSLWIGIREPASADLELWIQETMQRFLLPFSVGGSELFVSATFGLANYPSDGVTADELIRHVDLALFAAAETGHGSFQKYDSEMSRRVLRNRDLEVGLRTAIANNEMQLVFQPLMRIADDEMVGVEALIRWNHNSLGQLTPHQVLHLAEVAGVRSSLSRWVMETACVQINDMVSELGLPSLTLAVNISGSDFTDSSFVDRLTTILELTKFPPRMLQLEITEQVMISNPVLAVSIMEEVRKIGVDLCIDDFGTGYSSLSYLAEFPVSTIKIDRSFVANCATSRNHESIARAIIALARSLDVTALAEGVETKEQLHFMQTHGCTLAQGYYYSYPLPLERLRERLVGPAAQRAV